MNEEAKTWGSAAPPRSKNVSSGKDPRPQPWERMGLDSRSHGRSDKGESDPQPKGPHFGRSRDELGRGAVCLGCLSGGGGVHCLVKEMGLCKTGSKLSSLSLKEMIFKGFFLFFLKTICRLGFKFFELIPGWQKWVSAGYAVFGGSLMTTGGGSK